MAFNLDNYETVEERLVRWHATYPESRIITTMVHYDAKTVVFRAEGYVISGGNHWECIATGHAEEVLGSSPVNKTSFVENCETSAIGRMISNSPVGTKSGPRPSRQEMGKVVRMTGDQSERAELGSAARAGSTAHGGLATPKQLGYIKKLAKDRGWSEENLFDDLMEKFKHPLESLTAREASQWIDAHK